MLEIGDLYSLRICFALHSFYICLQINYQTKLCAIIEDCKRISPIISFRRMICRCFFLCTYPFYIPGEKFFQMIPYVVTLVALLWFGSKQPGPKANGQPYFREQR